MPGCEVESGCPSSKKWDLDSLDEVKVMGATGGEGRSTLLRLKRASTEEV